MVMVVFVLMTMVNNAAIIGKWDQPMIPIPPFGEIVIILTEYKWCFCFAQIFVLLGFSFKGRFYLGQPNSWRLIDNPARVGYVLKRI